MGVFRSVRLFAWNRPVLSVLLSFVGLFVVFGIAIAVISRTSDAETADKLAWNAAMAFGWAFWLLVLAVAVYAVVRVARWLAGKSIGG